MGLRGPQPRSLPVGKLNVEHGRPEMPAFVENDPVAADCFNRVCDHLEQAGVLRTSHGFALSVLASEWSRYIVAAEASRNEPMVLGGSGGPKANPAASVASTAAKQVVDILGNEVWFAASCRSEYVFVNRYRPEGFRLSGGISRLHFCSPGLIIAPIKI